MTPNPCSTSCSKVLSQVPTMIFSNLYDPTSAYTNPPNGMAASTDGGLTLDPILNIQASILGTKCSGRH